MVFRQADVEVNSSDIVSLMRLGKPRENHPRPIKVIFKEPRTKFALLNKRKMISTSEELKKTFNERIFVNSDSSFLVLKEEYRLRRVLAELKSHDPASKCYIRSGTLFVNGLVHDEINIRNQMF